MYSCCLLCIINILNTAFPFQYYSTRLTGILVSKYKFCHNSYNSCHVHNILSILNIISSNSIFSPSLVCTQAIVLKSDLYPCFNSIIHLSSGFTARFHHAALSCYIALCYPARNQISWSTALATHSISKAGFLSTFLCYLCVQYIYWQLENRNISPSLFLLLVFM